MCVSVSSRGGAVKVVFPFTRAVQRTAMDSTPFAASGATMRAVQYADYSTNIETLAIVHVPIPQPRPGQALVRIYYAAMNHIDLILFSGQLKGSNWKMDFPFTPGYDFSGVIVEMGEPEEISDSAAEHSHDHPPPPPPHPHNSSDYVPKPHRFAVGDEVFGVNWDNGRHSSKDPHCPDPIASCFAEYICISTKKLSVKPEDMSFERAACLSMVGTAALQCIDEIGYVTESSRVLIIGGGTLVGTVATQLAKQRGAFVISAQRPALLNREAVKALPRYGSMRHTWDSMSIADVVVNCDPFALQQHEDCRNLDFILDLVGDAPTLTVLKETPGMINVGAAYVNLVNPFVGVVQQAHPPFAYARFYCFRQDSVMQSKFGKLVDDGLVRVPISEIFPFHREGVWKMFRTMQARNHKGKLLLEMYNPDGHK